MLVSLFLANCLVSAAVGYIAAGWRFGQLAFRVAEMEAAVASYWDRIRKRMRVEPDQPTAAAPPTEDATAAAIAARHGLTYIKPKIIVPEVRRA